MVEALDTQNEVNVHAFFQVSFSIRTKAVRFDELKRVSTNFKIYEAKYS